MTAPTRLPLLALLLAGCAAPAPRPAPLAPPADVPPAPPPDPDGDGVVGAADRCPDAPEDCDGTDDADGCPDPDDDGDGVPDVCDACPQERGGFPDGCSHLVQIESLLIRIIEYAHFDENRAALQPRVVPMLEAVAVVLRERPDLRRVELRGHASRGERDAQRLSQRRAEAVMAWLVAHGVDAARLTARGYGVDVPIADPATTDGRARNRRVEFHLAEVDPPAPRPSAPRRVVPTGCPDAPPPPTPGPCAQPVGSG